jgi:hypothetical protein
MPLLSVKKPFSPAAAALIRAALYLTKKTRYWPFFILPLQNFCLEWQV